MKTLAFMDIGTNSVRLAIVKANKNSECSTIASHKEVVRLGEGEFAHNKITRSAMERGILVMRKFADIARKSGAQEIIAVATAAVREAQNRSEFVDRVRCEAGVDIKIISGHEEARLIYLGIASGVELNSKRALFIDIGGGTTELIVGNSSDHIYLDSIKLGAIRLYDIFLSGDGKPIPRKKYRTMIDYVNGAASRAIRHIRDIGFNLTFGSSGTIMNLAEITARRIAPDLNSIRNFNLQYSNLTETIEELCAKSVDERRSIPGINPERADIIVSGAAILDAIMQATGAENIRISDRALRDGLIIDRLFEADHQKREFMSGSVRARSILQLCRTCNFEEGHANNVATLAESLFKQLKDLGYHGYGNQEMEILRYASIAHDVGNYIAQTDHHKHSYYLIRNWNLLGFDDDEIEIIAMTAMCHRKMTPKKAANSKLDASSKRIVEVLASILRIADALDRSQIGLVKEVTLRRQKDSKKLLIEVYSAEDCPLEMWSFDIKKQLFEQTFDTSLSIRQFTRP